MGSILPQTHAAKGANFISAEAYEAYSNRRAIGWGVEPYRCERYLTSSQTLTFNLFASLGHDLAWLTRVLKRLRVAGAGEVHELSLEFQPKHRLAGHLDKTVADAFVSTDRGGVVIETKLADQFSKRRTIARARSYYDLINTSVPLWISEDMHFETGAQEQMARVHALGSLESNSPSTLLFIHHPLDSLSAAKIEKYRDLLLNPAQLQVVRLDHFVDALGQSAVFDEQRTYVDRLRVRYLDMHLSEGVFQAMEAARSRSSSRTQVLQRTRGL